MLARLLVRRERGRAGRGLPVWLPVRHGARRFLVADLSEIKALLEVLDQEQYALPPDFPVRTVLDLGSSVGGSIAYFKSRYPTATVHGYEPAASPFALLTANVADLPGVTVHQAATAGRDGTATLTVAADSWASSLSPGARSWGVQQVEVPTLTLDSALERLGTPWVDVVKMDIEGAELEALGAFPEPSAHVGMFIGELHPDLLGLSDEAAVRRLRELLPGFAVQVSHELGQDVVFRARNTVAEQRT